MASFITMSTACRLRKMNISRRICAFFSTTASNSGESTNKQSRKQARYMAKIVDKLTDAKKRKKWYSSNTAPVVHTAGRTMPVSQGMVRRAEQLSVVLQESVYNSFYYEDICPQLLQYSLNICQVKITPDFNNITVYWTATGDPAQDTEIAELLSTCRSKLRSSLISKRVIGRIPPIEFVKDSKISQVAEVEHLLSLADMGANHEPKPLGHQLKSPPRPHFSAQEANKYKSDGIDIQGIGARFDGMKFTLEDGPGAKLVKSQHANFGVSGSNFVDLDKLSPDDGTASLESSDVPSSEAALADDLSLTLRHDLYNLDHEKISQRVNQVKNKSRDRDYNMEGDNPRRNELSQLKSRKFKSVDLSSVKINKLLKESKKKQSPSLLLSSVATRDDEMTEQSLTEQIYEDSDDLTYDDHVDDFRDDDGR